MRMPTFRFLFFILSSNVVAKTAHLALCLQLFKILASRLSARTACFGITVVKVVNEGLFSFIYKLIDGPEAQMAVW